MTITISSITLAGEAVNAILTDHLNANVLRSPVSVTGVECLDGAFIVTLEPAAPAPLPPTGHVYTVAADPATSVTLTAPVNGHGHHNGNGHIAHSQDQEAAPQPAAEAPKRNSGRRLTQEEKDDINRLLTETDHTNAEIAERIGCHVTTINHYRNRLTATADATDGGE